jgi:hypothetical protein
MMMIGTLFMSEDTRKEYTPEQVGLLREAEVLIENWHQHDNAIRPHSALRYRGPAPQVILLPARTCPALPSTHGLADHCRT